LEDIKSHFSLHSLDLSIYLTFSDRQNDGGVVAKLLSGNRKMQGSVQEILLEIASPLNSLGICLCEGKMIENETF
jgi:hypothetical protein